MSKIILLRCGLANRLRTLIGFVYIGLETNKDFIFHWETKDPACNGTYSSVFEPFVVNYKNIKKKVQIIEKPHDPKLEYYFIGQDTTHHIIQLEAPHLIPEDSKKVANLYHSSYIQNIENIFYSCIVPKKYILNKVNNFLKRHADADRKITAAMHIRRTDHSDLAKKKDNFTGNDEFIKFAEEHKDTKIFLATDEKSVQDVFSKYEHVVLYQQIKQSMALRQTTLQDAVIDIFVAAVSKHFHGSGYSSYSHLIEIYRRINHLKSEYFYLYL
jgi:predicted XRE-type DNA-binding protein